MPVQCSNICRSVLGFCIPSLSGILRILGVGTGNGLGVGEGNEHHSHPFPKMDWVRPWSYICKSLFPGLLPWPFSPVKPLEASTATQTLLLTLGGLLGSEIAGEQLLEREGIFPSRKSWRKRNTPTFPVKITLLGFPCSGFSIPGYIFCARWILSRYQMTTVKKS